MKKLELTGGRYAKVDDEDYERVLAHGKWRMQAHAGGTTSYARCGRTRGGWLLHRFVLRLRSSAPRVDHINRDGLDCRKSNLRLATPSQNAMNRPLRRDNASGFRGVCFHTRCRKYQAYINVDYRRHHLGYFGSAVEAAVAYNIAAVEAHGSFAVLNTIAPEHANVHN